MSPRHKTFALVAGLVVTKLLVHLVVVERYGYHGDELYFIECARHLAFGYVDHPPLIPWIARACDALGGGLFVLRLPAIAAGAGTMVLVALLVSEWRGERVAQAFALLAMLFAPAYLRMAAMLDIPVIEVLLWTGASYLVARALGRGERRTWLLVGVVAGLGLLAKHSMLLWGAGMSAGLLATEHRRVLRTPWPWCGAVIALAVFAPNVVWQLQHGWPTLQFLREIQRDSLAQVGRPLFALGQLLYFHPLGVPIAVAGLVFAYTREGRAMRPFAWLFAVTFGVLLVTGAKPYYVAGAYPALFAAGGVGLERWLRDRKWIARTYGGLLAASGIGLAVLTLPVLPLPTLDATFGRLFGWAVPPIMLTHDMHGMMGWETHAATVARVASTLSADERARAAVLTGSYAQAAAVNVLGGEGVPPAISGHMSYFLWGPRRDRGDVLIAYGVERSVLEAHYGSVVLADRIVAPLARPYDTDLPVYLCREPRTPISAWWGELRRYGHGALAARSNMLSDGQPEGVVGSTTGPGPGG